MDTPFRVEKEKPRIKLLTVSSILFLGRIRPTLSTVGVAPPPPSPPPTPSTVCLGGGWSDCLPRRPGIRTSCLESKLCGEGCEVKPADQQWGQGHLGSCSSVDVSKKGPVSGGATPEWRKRPEPPLPWLTIYSRVVVAYSVAYR